MRQLSKEGLDIICAVQALRMFAIADAEITQPKAAWWDVCRKYYFEIARDLMASAGLRRNEHDFELVLNFIVSGEIRNTEYAALSKFRLDV